MCGAVRTASPKKLYAIIALLLINIKPVKPKIRIPPMASKL
jgi:hypothetical protein